jgi:hypothetical protein
MWVFTSTGFVSAVSHRDEPDLVVVRARDRASLTPLIERTGADLNPWTSWDYAFRIVVERTVFARWLAEQADAIDYANFKDRAKARRGGDFATALGEVWGSMHAFQQRQSASAVGCEK